MLGQLELNQREFYMQSVWTLRQAIRRNRNLVPSQSQMEILWQGYQEGIPDAKDLLVELYWPLVVRVTAKMHRNLPSHVDREDVASWGVIGLYRAIDRFDLSVGVQFETYAVASIRSVVLDELRKLDWAPRSLRRRQRDITEAREALEVELSRAPTYDEIGTKLGVSGMEIRKSMAAAEASYAKSLDEMASTDIWWANGNRGIGTDRIVGAETPDEARMTSLIGETVSKAIHKLTPQEQLILSLYYYYGMTLAEAGKVAGIPESRASQIHSRVVTRIRDELALLLRPDEVQASR